MTILSVPSTTDFSGQTLNDVEKIDFTNGLLDFVATASFSVTQFKGALPQIRNNVLIEGSGGPVVNAFVNRISVNGGSVDASGWSFNNWFSNDTIQLNGGELADTITGSSQKDIINGDAGVDIITGGAGADVLRGGNGSDIFRFAMNDIALGETIDGGQGTADQLTVSGNVILSNATVTGVERLVFESGSIVGVSTSDASQFGSGAINRVVGGLGKDIVSITGQAIDVTTVTFYNWAATDEINLFGSTSNDTIIGSDRNDRLSGGLGNDTLVGGVGNDKFVYAGFGHEGTAETVDGGAGTADALVIAAAQTYDFSALASLTGVEVLDFGSHLGSNVAVFAGAQMGGTGIRRVDGNSNSLDQLMVRGAFVNLSSVSFIDWATGADSIQIEGDPAAESRLTGSRENDVIFGGQFDDFLQGLAGADTLFGDAGIDTVSYALSGAVAIDILANTFTGSHAEGDSFSGVENIIGSAFSDSLTGDDNDNRLTGGDGNDVLEGGKGVDALFGGEGNDRFVYSSFQDVSLGETVRGGNGVLDTLVVSTTFGNSTNISSLSVLDVERLEFDSSVLSSRFVILSDDQIGAGSRQISSVKGSDENERLNINGNTIDLSSVTFLNWSATDRIDLINDSSSPSSFIGSSQNENFVGGGSGAGDVFDGRGGNDELLGGSGRDILTGGLGQDVFKYTDSNDSGLGALRDTITDFTVVAGGGASFVDRIMFEFRFTEPEPNAFIGFDAFTAAGQVRAVQSGTNTLLQINLTGTSGTEMEIILQGVTASDLTASDFIFA